MTDLLDRPVHVRLEGIRKTFGEDTAVDRVSLEIHQGEFLVLLGPSGCGKSTTLNMIAGFLRPDEGDVFVDDRSIVDLPVHKRNIGVVFQSYSLFPHMTVFQNTAFGLRRRRVPSDHIERRVMEKLALVEMEDFRDRFPDQLSGGQQQRVAIARALVIEPQLLLLDEPLSNLDAKLRVEMREEIRNLVTVEGVTTVFVTHDQEEALTIGDRIGVMSRGHLVQLATPRDVYHRPVDLAVAGFVGRSNRIVGEVVEVDGTSAVLRADDGTLVRGRCSIELAVGMRGVALVRPEAVQFRPNGFGPADNELEATLSSEAFLGQSVELRFDRGPEFFVMAAGDGHGLEIGQTCRLHWARESTMVFPESSP